MIEILKKLLQPRLILALTVVGCATAALLCGRLDGAGWAASVGAAMWWTAVAGACAIFTVRGMEADHQQANELRS